MKHRNLSSFAHNFTHSFVSMMNYVDDGYVIDDLMAAARQTYEGPLIIFWIPADPPNHDVFSDRVLKSIELFRQWLPEHAGRHDVTMESIRAFRLEMFRLPSYQLRFDSVLVDDKNREYRKSVQF